MPNTQIDKSAEKRVRQDRRKRAHNRLVKGYIRDMMRQIRGISDSEAVEKALPHAYSVLDKAAKKGVIHRKTSARYKSRLSARANRLKTASS
ncbi:30S ribosomal protein S20 [bacterium]|nr:30S ribosomal protein S20 [bacterium]